MRLEAQDGGERLGLQSSDGGGDVRKASVSWSRAGYMRGAWLGENSSSCDLTVCAFFCTDMIGIGSSLLFKNSITEEDPRA